MTRLLMFLPVRAGDDIYDLLEAQLRRLWALGMTNKSYCSMV